MEEFIVKKSIFKQKQFKETYEKEYDDDSKPNRYIHSKQEEIAEEYKFECNLAMPLLKSGESFYIEEDNKLVKIRGIIRTSKDNVLYECCSNIIEDNEQKEKLKQELTEEIKLWYKNHPDIKGIRKLVKKLFKL
jgi:hypothetical protein